MIPDLACYGKAMANGYPLACVVGPAKWMDAAIYVSGTYGGEALSLAAGGGTLEVYKRDDAIMHIWAAGSRLLEGFNELASAFSASFPIRMAGAGCRLRFVVGEGTRPYNGHVWTPEERFLILSLFLQEAAANGVLFHPSSILPSASHDAPGVIEEALAGCSAAMQVVLDKIGDGEASPETIYKALKGLPSRPVFDRMRGAS